MALKLLTLVCLAGAALAGPFQRDVGSQCATSCPTTSHQKFDYQPGSQYNYRYKGIDYISAAGNRKQQKYELSADVEINVLEKCEMTIQLTNIRYHGENPLSRELEEQLAVPLHFSWVDGNIENICSSSEESQESENIKRGILSAIVNNMSDLRSSSQQRELDSLGSCETKYTILRNAAGSVTIRKEKSLKSCDNRHSGLASFPFNPYQSPESKIQALPLFTHEKSECEQVIQNDVIQQVSCKAKAQLQPLSRYDSIVEFQGEVQLELKNVQKSSMQKRTPISQLEKKSILYSYDQKQDLESREREVNEILSELCPKTQGLLHPSVSKLFVRLVSALKGLPAENVRRIHESLRSRRLCDSPKTLDMFLDALPMAGTEGSIKLMVELLQTKQVSSLKAKIWPASFALIPNPSAEAISAVLPLVSSEEKSRPVLLGLSAMIYKVCSNRDCDQIESVRNAVLALQQGLGSQCSTDNEDEVISILKAFGNMGYHGQAEETILACAQSRDKSVNVRLAAVDAFRRYTKKIPSAIIELFASQNEHFELRIAALVTIVKNDDERIAQAIERVLEKDQDEQVIAFTTSLVKNLKKSSSPLKQNMRQLLQNVQTRRDVGYWENSKNVELSAFNVPTNVGASLESNIIHAQGLKVPRSMSSKIDIDIFGKNVNVFEFGVRAEGLEKAVKKILGMDESNKQKKSWFALTSKSNEEEDRSELSFYLRTMGTEFLDMNIQDFTSVGNMMQFADVVNKLSQGEKADFAHSFLFLNTKLIIPSVTGRSYAFGMTGSATVGLSADGKFDVVNLMSSPRNCDIGGRFQPSANVEITTTLGIHSEKSRPDIKIVTSFHSESDVGAKLRVKDSHIAEARLDMPSDKVQLLKVSTELFEVDANENETPIIEDMQQKINHCIKSLEKPMGIQLCGKLETPRPFVSKNFPYARGIGNIELSITKTDSSMRGYSVSLEIPKHKSDHMSYRFIVDTPGSSIRRKFQGSLDVRKSASGECEFKLDAQSPFKDISTSGSYTWRSNYAQGSLNIVADKSRRYSVKAVMEMSRSNSEMTLKPTLQWTLPESEPVSVSGSIVYNKSRKQHIMVDLRSSKPGMKPYVLTGNLMKDGQIGLTKRHQWKMSADLVAKTPLFSTKVHSTVDKQAGQSQGISSSLSVDYETQRLRKQSIKFSSKAQQNSAKVSASAQFETTQNPKLNWAMNWDMQGNPKEAMKNDLMLKYGRNPEQTYIQISQNSQVGDKNSPAEGKIAVKAPQFSIDSEMKLALGLNVQNSGNFHLESDLRYKENQHVQCSVQLKQLSKRPIKMALKAQLEYPGRKLMYKDEIEETSPNTFQGRSTLQWQSNQQATLQYKYKKLSDDSTFHHEIETTLNAPFMRSQITNQASVKASREAMEIQAQLQTSRQSTYKVNAQLKRRGQSQLQISSPVADAEIELNNKEEQKSCKAMVQLKKHNPRRILASAALNLGSRKSMQAEASWDAERNPSQKISIAAEYEINSQRGRQSFSANSQLQVLDLISATISSSGQKGSPSILQTKIDVSCRKFKRVVLDMHHELTSESFHSTIRCQHGQQEKAIAELNGKYVMRSDKTEIQASASLKSPDRSFEDKELSVEQSYVRSRSSTNLKYVLHFENAPGKKHEFIAEYLNEPRLAKKLRIAAQTPYQRFEQQELILSQRKEQDKQTINAVIQYLRKEITLNAITAKTSQGRSIEMSLRTPLRAVREASVLVAIENQRSEKNIESRIELNGQRMLEASGRYSSRHGQQSAQANVLLRLKSELALTCKAEKSQDSLNHELTLRKDSTKVLSYKVSHKVSGEEFLCQIEAECNRNTVLDVKMAKEVKGQVKYSLKINKPIAPISVVIQTSKSDRNSRNVMISACKESGQRQCLNVKGYYKQEKHSDKYNVYKKITLDLEKETGRGNAEPLCNIHFLHATQEHTLKSKLHLEVKEKKYGYEVVLKERNNKEKPCELEASITLPSRTLHCSVSALHNERRYAYQLIAIPNTSSPNSKITLEMQKDWNSRNNEVSGQWKLNHPALNNPVSAKYVISKEQSQWPAAGKLEFDYSRDQKDNIVIEFSNQSPRSQPEKKALQLNIFTQSKELDLTLKASVHQTSHKDVISSEWSWQAQQGRRSGNLNIELSEKKSGRPQNIQIRYACPHTQYLVEGQVQWQNEKLPAHVQLTLSSQSRRIGQIEINHAESCTDLEIKSSTPLLKNRVCVNKKQPNRITVLSVETICENNVCLTAQIDLDPSQTHIANIAAKWQKEEFRQLLKTVKKQLPTLEQLPYREVKQEMQHKVKTVCSPLKQQVLKPILAHVVEQIQQIAHEQKQELQQIKQQWRQLVQMLPKLPTTEEIGKQIERVIEFVLEDVIRFVEEHAPEWFANLVKSIKEYFHEICRRGTFCYQVKQAYQRRGIHQVRRLLKSEFSEKIDKLQRSKNQKIDEVKDSIRKIWEKVKSWCDELKENMSSWMPSWKQSELVRRIARSAEKAKEQVKRCSQRYLEKLMEIIDKVLDHARKNEDFKVLSSLLDEAKTELVKASRTIDLERKLVTLKDEVMEKISKGWLQEKVNVSDFDVDSGNVQVKLYHPFDESKLQFLKNVLVMVKNKCATSFQQ